MSIFSKKHLNGLEKARQMNLITEIECLRLKKERLDEQIKKHLEKHGGRKKKK
jgi:hypothetical protein